MTSNLFLESLTDVTIQLTALCGLAFVTAAMAP